MNEKNNLVYLFTDLNDVLGEFIITYRTDHPNLLATETVCLNKLNTIADELKLLLKDQTSKEKFTLNKYEVFILRIDSLKPIDIVRKQKSSGFLGLIGASEHEEKVASPLGNAMTNLVKRLETKLDMGKKQEAQARQLLDEKKTLSESSLRLEKLEYSFEKTAFSSIEMELIKNQLLNLTQRVTTSEQLIQQAYDNGKKAGQQEMMARLREVLGKYLDAPQQQQLFLSLEPTESKTPNLGMATIPVVFSQNAEGPKVKSEEEEKEKARQWIGQAKFPAIEAFVELHNISDASKIEKLIAKWAIFEFMWHKYDQRVSQVLTEIKEALSSLCHLSQFPRLNTLFETYVLSSNQDVITTQTLSQKELSAFFQLTNNQGFYLPQDGTAANCFASHLKQMKGENVALTTQAKYRENVLGKMKQELGNTPSKTV